MARTYGEILDNSFAGVFALCDEDTLFLDVGSGRGLIVAASVQQGGCYRAVGIEKYNDKLQESQELLASLPEDVQSKIDFLLGDFNDHDLTAMLQSYACTSLLMFCNNLAFQHGTNIRMSKNFRRAMNALPSVKFTVVATTPLEALADRLHSTIPLDMTWAPGHMCQVYSWHGLNDVKAGVAA